MRTINLKHIIISLVTLCVFLFQNCSSGVNIRIAESDPDLGSELPLLPEIFDQPLGQELNEGDVHELYVEVRGLEDYTVAWYFNGVELKNINSTVLEIGPVTPDMSGEYIAVVRKPPHIELQSDIMIITVLPAEEGDDSGTGSATNPPITEPTPIPEPIPTPDLDRELSPAPTPSPIIDNSARDYLREYDQMTESDLDIAVNKFCKSYYGERSEAIFYTVTAASRKETDGPICKEPTDTRDSNCVWKVNLTKNRFLNIRCANSFHF